MLICDHRFEMCCAIVLNNISTNTLRRSAYVHKTISRKKVYIYIFSLSLSTYISKNIFIKMWKWAKKIKLVNVKWPLGKVWNLWVSFASPEKLFFQTHCKIWLILVCKKYQFFGCYLLRLRGRNQFIAVDIVNHNCDNCLYCFCSGLFLCKFPGSLSVKFKCLQIVFTAI